MSHVLLIEPDFILASTYSKALIDAGFSVASCTGAQSAIFASDQNTPDLIILELQLVGHSGIEFLYELRSYPDWQSIPVVIHSQVPSSEFLSQINLLKDSLNIHEYLYKPQTTLADLIGKVSKYTKEPK